MNKSNPKVESRDEQEQNRFNTLLSLFIEFIKQYEIEQQNSVYLNKELLYAVVKSYFDDIYRFKEYSGSQRADQHKQAGFSVKWIAKFRPIQIKENAKIDEYVLFINSSFSIFVGFSFLNIKVSDSITPHYFKHLLYVTQYRNLSGKQLASLFYVLEKSSKGEKP